MMITSIFLAAKSSGDTFSMILAIIAVIVIIFYVIKYSLFAFWLVTGGFNNSNGKRIRYTKADKEKFNTLVNQSSAKAIEAVDKLKTFFLPSKRVSQGDLDSFLADYKETIISVEEIYRSNYKNNDVLRSRGIQAFHEQINSYHLTQLMKENNEIYDSIQRLKQISETAFNSYNNIFTTNHYCTHSEMQSFLTSTSEIESLAAKLLPKYNEYITDNVAKTVIYRRKYIVHERKEHNEAFVRRELDENKTYFDTVLGQYPLDPQQRDSIVKLEDNCLVIASAGSGKTSTFFEERFFGGYY
jgi:protein-tyrosine-phosphatase